MAGYTATVNPNTVWVKSWEGWGCPLCWWANCPLATNDALLDILYTTNYVNWNGTSLPGLGYNIVRYNLGACCTTPYGGVQMYAPDIGTYQKMPAYWTNWASANPNSSSWSWTQDNYQRAALLGAQARGANIFEMFANSPVWWMLYNYDPAGNTNGAANNLQSWNYDQDTIYLATVARYFQTNWGLTFTDVEPFNEPVSTWWKWNGGQEGCHFNNSTQSNVVSYLRTELNNRSLNSTIIAASDDNNIGDATNTWNSFDSTTRSQIARINVHGYGGLNPGRDVLYGQAQASGKDLWVSEYGENDTSGLTMAENLEADFSSLHESAWCYWLPYEGANWGFIATTLPNLPTTIFTKYYVMAHFSRHIRPGMMVIDGGNPAVASAYDPVHYQLAIVSQNGTSGQWPATYVLTNFAQVGGPVTQWQMEMLGGSDRYAEYTNVTLSGKQFQVGIPTNTMESFEVQNVAMDAMWPPGSLRRDDFNGDGYDDYVFFRPSDGSWHITYSSNLATNVIYFGTNGDVPLLDGDWDGDGIADPVVFHPADCTWHVLLSASGTTNVFQFGTNGDIPLLGGDFDGDGIPDAVVWRPSDGTWHIRSSITGNELTNFQYGAAGDVPLLNGDFDGDGIPDAVIWRPSNGTWFIHSSKTGGQFTSFSYGVTGDVPVLGGDYDGDGIPDATVFRPSTGVWYIRSSIKGSTLVNFQWGTTNDIPWASCTTSDHFINENIYRPSSGRFYLRDYHTGTYTSIPLGTSTDIPVH